MAPPSEGLGEAKFREVSRAKRDSLFMTEK